MSFSISVGSGRRCFLFGRWAWVLLAGSLAGYLARPANAQVTVEVTPGLGGFYRTTGWLPIQVRLENQGPSAEVSVTIQALGLRMGEARLPARRLPAGARERRLVYLPLQNSIGNRIYRSVTQVNGEALAPQAATGTPLSSEDHLVVAVGPGLQGLVGLSGTEFQFSTPKKPAVGTPLSLHTLHVVALEPGGLPDRWQGLNAAEVVVLGRVPERDLTEDQQATLRKWVAAGGKLVITGDAELGRFRTPFYRDLLPVTVTGVEPANRWDYIGLRSGSVPMNTFRLVEGAEWWRTPENGPGIPSRRLGLGTVVFLPAPPDSLVGARDRSRPWLDLVRAPIRRTLLARQAEVPDEDFGLYSAGANALRDVPFQISQMDIPAFYLVAGFLIFYVIVLVPGQYFLLKRFDKREWAWLTSPLIAVLFSLGAYWIGFAHRGGRMLVSQVSILETAAESSLGTELVCAGLFSPSRQQYTVRARATGPDSDGLIRLAGETPGGNQSSYGLGEDPTLSRVSIDMWAMKVFDVERTVALGDGVRVEWRQSGNGVTGVVANRTGMELRDVELHLQDGVSEVGSLRAGDTRTFNGAIRPEAGPGWNRNARRRSWEDPRQIREAVRETLQRRDGLPTRPFLLAWKDGAEPAVEVTGMQPQTRSTTAVIVYLDEQRSGGR